jgi:hypothetical protein
MIHIRLLGPFEATLQDGTSVRPPGRRSLCLLACLAQAEAPRWQRHELAALLWHGRAPEQARGSLRQELVRLRRAFGPLLDDCRSGDQQLMPVLAPDRVEVIWTGFAPPPVIPCVRCRHSTAANFFRTSWFKRGTPSPLGSKTTGGRSTKWRSLACVICFVPVRRRNQ